MLPVSAGFKIICRVFSPVPQLWIPSPPRRFCPLLSWFPSGACTSLSEAPLLRRTWIFPSFLAIYFQSWLQQLHLCWPLYLALSLCNPFFTPTYNTFYYHMGPFTQWWGTLLPWGPPSRQGSAVVCTGSVAVTYYIDQWRGTDSYHVCGCW